MTIMLETREQVKPVVKTPQASEDWLMGWYRVFQSLPLAITLLALLAIGVMVGVFMPQEGLVETAQIKAQVGENYRLFKAMGLFNVYSSPWFLTVEILFFFNLLLGSFQWLRPAFRAATQRTFCGPEHIQASPNKMMLTAHQSTTDVIPSVVKTLKKYGYTLHQSQVKRRNSAEGTASYLWYAHKGDWSRLGPVLAHFGILVMLLASVYGVFSGFKGQQMMSPGDDASFTTLDSFTPNIGQPYWIGSKPDWKLKLHDFKIDYYAADPTTPKQYTSDLELLDKSGRSLARQFVSVNHPLSYEGVMFYQASFAPTGRLFLTVNGKPVISEVNTNFQDRPIALTPIGEANENRALMVFPFFVKQDAGVEKNHIRVFLHEGDHLWGAEAGKMPPNLTLYEGDTKTLGPVTVSYQGPEIATGFQIKKAPETPWIYGGFFFISLGTAMCFMTQRQIWLAVLPDEGERKAKENTKLQVVNEPSVETLPDTSAHARARVMLTYKTHKAPVGFYKELSSIQAQWLNDWEGTLDVAVTPYQRAKKRSRRERAMMRNDRPQSVSQPDKQEQHPAGSQEGVTPHVV